MADSTMLELPSATAIDGSEYAWISQTGTDKRVQLGLIMAGSASQSTQSANTVFAGPTTGAAAAPTFRALVAADFGAVTWTVPQGGTGLSSLTAYALLAGGTTSTGAMQQVSGVGTLGQVLVSAGAGTLPSWQSAPAAIGAALTRVDDTNVTVTLGGTPATALLQAVSLTMGWSGQLSLARGGTNANLTASNGGIFYSTATAGAILAGTATAGQILSSGASAAPSWSTATFPTTAAANTVLGAATANVITALATPQISGIVLSTNTTSLPAAPGTTTQTRLQAGSADGNATRLHLDAFGTTATVFSGRLARNTAAVPSAVQTNDVLTALQAFGYGATGYSATARVSLGLAAAENWTDSAQGTYATVSITPTGSTTPREAFRVENDNSIKLFGTSSGTVIVTPQSAAGTPTLTLPNATGTLAASATAPITLNATTGAIGITGAALTRTDDTNVTLTLGGTPASALVTAASLTLGWTGQLGLTRGGTAASLTASNGGIVYSTASALAILAGTATAGQIIRSGSSTTPSWSTSTYPATSAAGTVNASLTANTITATVSPVLGAIGGGTGTLGLSGNTSGVVTVQPQAAAGTYNFNLPTGAGTSGQPLLSAGGGASPMTFGTLGLAYGGTNADLSATGGTSRVLKQVTTGAAVTVAQLAAADLSDYATGTWTPTLTFSTPGDLSITYAAQAGSYTRIGRLVMVTFSLVSATFTHTTASGAVFIAGMPFTPASGVQYIGSMIVGGITMSRTQWVPRAQNSMTTNIEVLGNGTAVASSNVGAADMPTAGTVNFRGCVTFEV